MMIIKNNYLVAFTTFVCLPAQVIVLFLCSLVTDINCVSLISNNIFFIFLGYIWAIVRVILAQMKMSLINGKLGNWNIKFQTYWCLQIVLKKLWWMKLMNWGRHNLGKGLAKLKQKLTTKWHKSAYTNWHWKWFWMVNKVNDQFSQRWDGTGN